MCCKFTFFSEGVIAKSEKQVIKRGYHSSTITIRYYLFAIRSIVLPPG